MFSYAVRGTVVIFVLLCSSLVWLSYASITGFMQKQLEDSRMIFYVNKISETLGPIGIFNPSEGYKFVIVEVIIKNKMEDPLSFSALFAKIRDSLNYEYGSSAATTNIDFAFTGGKIAPKDIIRGYVVFEIPENASGSMLIYADLFSEFRVNLIPSEIPDPIPVSEYHPTVGVGGTVDDGRVALTFISFEETKWIGVYHARNGWKFIIVDIRIRNLSNQKISYNLLYIDLKDSQGHMFGVHMATSALEGGLQSGNLLPGEIVNGKVAFEVPENENYFVIHYDDFSSFLANLVIPEFPASAITAILIASTILIMTKNKAKIAKH